MSETTLYDLQVPEGWNPARDRRWLGIRNNPIEFKMSDGRIVRAECAPCQRMRFITAIAWREIPK